jgi:hypothetical protein
MDGGPLRYDMSIPSKHNSASFSEADLGRGTASPTKPGVYWFQSETMARALLVEVRAMNGELTVWWPNQDTPVADLTGCWHGPISPSAGPGSQ